MNERLKQLSDEKRLQSAVTMLKRHINDIVPVIQDTVLGTSCTLIGGNAEIILSVGFMTTLIEGKTFSVPTIFSMDLTHNKGSGYGTKLVGKWEKAMVGYDYLGAHTVTNPSFWSKLGYSPHDNQLWIKKQSHP